MSYDSSFEKGNVHWTPATATDNISEYTLDHPLAVVREPIGHVWHGAVRTSRKSGKKNGSIPSPPLPALGLCEEGKNWNVDPYANVIDSNECRHKGMLPSVQKKEVISLYENFILESKMKKALKKS